MCNYIVPRFNNLSTILLTLITIYYISFTNFYVKSKRLYNFKLNIDSNYMKIKNSLKENTELIKNIVNGEDIIYFSFTIKGVESVLIYPESLSDKEMLGKLVINPLSEYKGEVSIKEIFKKIALPEASKLNMIEKFVQKIMIGDAVLFIDGEEEGIALASKKPTSRPVTEPPTSTVLKVLEKVLLKTFLKTSDLFVSD